MIKTYLFNHTSENTAYLVSDSPYGFRLRTQIRYWIETTKQGDRFCSQTLNPKSGLWNKPKKSTYQAIGVIGLDELDHITWRGISRGWTNEEEATKFITDIGGIEKLSPAQLAQYKVITAISRPQAHIHTEIINATAWTPEQEEAHKAQQAQVKEDIQKVFRHELNQL